MIGEVRGMIVNTGNPDMCNPDFCLNRTDWKVPVPSYTYNSYTHSPEKVRYKVIGVEMKGMESSMKLVALGATQRKG